MPSAPAKPKYICAICVLPAPIAFMMPISRIWPASIAATRLTTSSAQTSSARARTHLA
jgi:hypothetical protein